MIIDPYLFVWWMSLAADPPWRNLRNWSGARWTFPGTMWMSTGYSSSLFERRILLKWRIHLWDLQLLMLGLIKFSRSELKVEEHAEAHGIKNEPRVNPLDTTMWWRHLTGLTWQICGLRLWWCPVVGADCLIFSCWRDLDKDINHISILKSVNEVHSMHRASSAEEEAFEERDRRDWEAQRSDVIPTC